jgi:tRNA threonylcarbamoyl adenosine modification protein YeaZ
MKSNTKLGLAVDLSSPTGSFSIFSESSGTPLLFERELPGTNTHSESLLHELQLGLKEIKAGVEDLSRFVLSSGPGSFTGLRIAYSTLKAFAFAFSKPVFTVEGPEARALGFLKESKASFEHIQVLTYLTADKFVASTFLVKSEKLEKVAESVLSEPLKDCKEGTAILFESRISPLLFKIEKGSAFLFPLRSSHLCLFESAQSLKQVELAELASLAPAYFGSSHFD